MFVNQTQRKVPSVVTSHNCIIIFANELWQNNACSDFVASNATNPKGEFIGQASIQRALFCQNCQEWGKYTFINLIHTWSFVDIYISSN